MRLEGAHQRAVLALGPQVGVDLPQRAARRRSRGCTRIVCIASRVAIVDGASCAESGSPVALGDEDHVDVAHVVELAGAGLAHPDDREPGGARPRCGAAGTARSPRGRRRARASSAAAARSASAAATSSNAGDAGSGCSRSQPRGAASSPPVRARAAPAAPARRSAQPHRPRADGREQVGAQRLGGRAARRSAPRSTAAAPGCRRKNSASPRTRRAPATQPVAPYPGSREHAAETAVRRLLAAAARGRVSASSGSATGRSKSASRPRRDPRRSAPPRLADASSAEPLRSSKPARARSVSRRAPTGARRSEDLEVASRSSIRRDLRAVLLPLAPLVQQHVVEDLLAERLGDELATPP